MTDQSDADYQEEWEELPEKVLLASLLAEQQRTNQLLAQLTDTDSEGDVDGEATPMFECVLCGDTVRKGKRQRHAMGQHNTPPDGWKNVFERVE